MYKVTYYYTGSSVTFKWFKTFGEATEFARTIRTGDVIEIKLYKDADESSVNH
jgi:hypothetical protein